MTGDTSTQELVLSSIVSIVCGWLYALIIVIIQLLKYREEWGDYTHKEFDVFTTIFVGCISVILLLLCVI